MILDILLKPEIIVIEYLLILCIFDVVYHRKQFPIIASSLTTFFIILNLFLFIYNKSNIYGMITCFLFGLILINWKFFEGEEDLKVITAMGIMLGTFEQIAVYLVLFVLFGMIYKIAMKKIIKNIDEAPFIPIFLISYIPYLMIFKLF